MRTLILVLLAAVIGLGLLDGQQAATIKDQQRRITDMDDRIKVASLAQQERCSNEAQKWFAQQGFGINDLASYENHYNVKLNRCMIAVENKFFANKLVLEFSSIVNVFENKKVANYVQQVGDGERARVTHCTVTNSSGEVRQCQSLDEFKKMTAAYMHG